ncbi:MAG: amino acid ABC transporter permease [Treponema sp.]|nr:amino acid ABC transporter permease [Treponema sp.]
MRNFFEWDTFLFFLSRIVTALPVTLGILGVSTAAGLALGLVLAFVQVENIPAAKSLARILVSFIRGTPVIVQMFLVYYGLPFLLLKIGVNITRWDKIIFLYITYGISTGAYFSEIMRSAIQSVPASQRDAAFASGLSKTQAYRRILIPQAIPVAVPSLGTGIVGLLQDTSLAFMLGVTDVIGRVRALSSLRARVLEGYVAAALLFVILSAALEKVFGVIEARTARGPEYRGGV